MTLLRIGSTATLGATVIAPVGELDMGSVVLLEEALANAEGHTNVIIDLRRVEFMDSTGLEAILRAAEAMASRGADMRVIPGRPCVDRLFDITETRARVVFTEPRAADAPTAEVWLG